MGMWLWVLAIVLPVVLAALWVDAHRGSRDEYRSADLPATKRGRPRPVDFDHTVGPCHYDVGPDSRTSWSAGSRGRHAGT